MAGMTAQQLVVHLGLEPLEGEGGFYRRVFLDPQTVETAGLGPFAKPLLPLSSTIYYLVTPESFSALHKLAGSEIWTWIAGDSLEQVLFYPDGSIEQRLLGLGGDAMPVSVVPGGCWQGTRLTENSSFGYALCSTVMSPAYDPSDFTLADAGLYTLFPSAATLIGRFIAHDYR
jgi:predicted cupin superfamily sugar epimerase